MNAPLPRSLQFDVQGLIHACAHNISRDAFHPALNPQQWALFGTYLQPFAARQGQVLAERHAEDRAVYFVESGQLTVHYEDHKQRLRMATVEAGSAVGEGAFFSRQPRNATVQAAAACKLWTLTPVRFSELSNRQPQLAVEVAMALGALIAQRLANRPQRVAVT